jgi:phage shock protein PspC (stress-responsive transcriptional regulator)
MDLNNRKMYRSRDSRMIAGVCGGLSKHLSIDPRLLRWIFVLTAEVTAPVYLLLWIYLDEEPAE